jgi:hypothetical protein
MHIDIEQNLFTTLLVTQMCTLFYVQGFLIHDFHLHDLGTYFAILFYKIYRNTTFTNALC